MQRILRSNFGSEKSLLRGSKLDQPSSLHPIVGTRIEDFGGVMSNVEFDSDIDLEAFPRVGIMLSLYSLIRNIKFPRDWTLDTAREDRNDYQSFVADSDGQSGSASSVAFENQKAFVSMNEVSIVPASAPEEPVTDAFRSVIFQLKGLENLIFEDSEAVIAWRMSACQALFILSRDFGYKSPGDLDQAIPQLLAVALALCQVEEYYWACDAMNFVVIFFRDKLQRASTSDLDRLNLINALGALIIIFREANISVPCNNEFQPASVPADEAIELLRPLYEHDKAGHRQSMAMLQIEYALCVLSPEKREVSALESGRRAVREAVELCRHILSDDSTSWESKLLLARALHVQAMLHPHSDDKFDRSKVAEEALDHLRDVTKIKPGPFDLQLADAVHSFASLNIIDSRSALSEGEAIYEALSTVTPGQFDTKLSEVRRWLTRYDTPMEP
ncbi:hypothetical protein CF327_g1434 [Tilletia walkeri]|nr:hypothetical protein CF327_g1434 [Tilletia walkeri]